MLNKELAATASDSTRQLLTESIQAADHLRDMLQKLNATVVYRPTPYAGTDTTAPAGAADDSHIIEV